MITFLGCKKEEAFVEEPETSISLEAKSIVDGSKTTSIIVSGRNFGEDPKAVRVYIDGKQETVLSVSGNEVVVALPRGHAERLEVAVWRNDILVWEGIWPQFNKPWVSTAAGSGGGFVDGPVSSAKFDQPFGLDIDNLGNIYIADRYNTKIRKIAPNGVVSTLAGSSYGFADGAAAKAKFKTPFDVAVGPLGNLYVADGGNHKIRKITPKGEVSTLAGSTVGFADGQGAKAKFSYPRGVVVDKMGNVYVTDRANTKIRKITPDGVVSTIAGSTYGYADGVASYAKFKYPEGIDIDASGNLYVTDGYNHSIRKITPAGFVITIAGIGLGFANGPALQAKFAFPGDLAVDGNGNIYIADMGNHKIRKMSASGTVTTLAGSTIGYKDGYWAFAKFNYPRGLAVNASGEVYVADSTNDKIRKIIQ